MVSSIGAERDAVAGEELRRRLDVVADLQDRRVLEDRLQERERLGERQLAAAPARRRGRPAPATWPTAGRRPRPGRSRGRCRPARRASRRRRWSRWRGRRRRGRAMRASQAASAAASRTITYGVAVDRRQRHRLAGGLAAPGPAAPRRTGAIVGASTPSFAATRPARPRNSISLEERRAGVSASGSRTSRPSSGVGERHVALQGDEVARDADLVGVAEQRLAALRLLDLAGAGEQRVEVAVLGDELRGGLDADAGGAGDVVDRIAGERLHVDRPGRGRRRTSRPPRRGRSACSSGCRTCSMPGATSCIRSLSAETMVTAAAGGGGLGGVGGDDVVGLEARPSRCRAG